jgi:hypothetical protein
MQTPSFAALRLHLQTKTVSFRSCTAASARLSMGGTTQQIDVEQQDLELEERAATIADQVLQLQVPPAPATPAAPAEPDAESDVDEE